MKRLFGLKKKLRQPATPANNQAAASSSNAEDGGFSDEYEDDEHVHDFEIAQEDYLVSVALATSAQEYQAASREAGSGVQILAAPGAASLSRKYYTRQCIDYDEAIPDGFYEAFGDFPELVEPGELPTLAALRHAQIIEGDLREVLVVNHPTDTGLCSVEEQAMDAAAHAAAEGDLAQLQAVAQVVAHKMGGPCSSNHQLRRRYYEAAGALKSGQKSMLLRLGSLNIGTSRHRALLFKVVADSLGLRCQLRRGLALTGDEEDGQVRVQVRGGEYVLDLVEVPGRLLPTRDGQQLLQPGAAASSSMAYAQQQQRQQQQQAWRPGSATSAAVAATSAVAVPGHNRPTHNPFAAAAGAGAGAAGRAGKQQQQQQQQQVPGRGNGDLIALGDHTEELSYGRSSILSQNSGLPSLTLTDDEPSGSAAGRSHQQQQAGRTNGAMPHAAAAAGRGAVPQQLLQQVSVLPSQQSQPQFLPHHQQQQQQQQYGMMSSYPPRPGGVTPQLQPVTSYQPPGPLHSSIMAPLLPRRYCKVRCQHTAFLHRAPTCPLLPLVGVGVGCAACTHVSARLWSCRPAAAAAAGDADGWGSRWRSRGHVPPAPPPAPPAVLSRHAAAASAGTGERVSC